MDLFDKISKNIIPKVTEGWDKLQSYFGRIFKDFDVHLLKVKNVLNETKRELRYFLDERDRIHKELKLKELHIERLRRELSSLKENQHGAYQQLHAELSLKLDELLQIQSKYWEVDAKVKHYEEKIDKLMEEKRTLEEDRKNIRLEYDQINRAYQEKEREIQILTSETEALREKEVYLQSLLAQNPSIQETERIKSTLDQLQATLEEKERERSVLENQYRDLDRKKKQLERELLNMTLLLNEKSNSMLQLTQQLEQISLEKDKMRESLSVTEKELYETRNQIQNQQFQLTMLEQREASIKQELLMAQQEKEELLEKNEKDFTEFISAMDKYKQDIDELNEKLEKQQQENAKMAYEHENGKVLSEDERKILEREYEPRFREIYPNMSFTPQFFKDFFHLTVSDRIKAELKIAQLHYQFDTVDSKIRNNTVKTKSGSVAEFPFSHEGRIYFRRQNNVIYVYRLNRTKSEQLFVIKWLQNSL